MRPFFASMGSSRLGISSRGAASSADLVFAFATPPIMRVSDSRDRIIEGVLFELEDVTYSRGGKVVLREVGARLPVGSSSLLGPSGSGKSTLLRLLNRLADPESGRIIYEGRDVREYDPLALRREVSLVPQLPALIDGTVHDNVAYGPRLAGRSFDARSCLELAGLDPGFENRDASKLSVGEQQRVMLARALALEPRVLLLDEPTAALDQAARDAVEGTLKRLRARTAISVVVVTHDIAQARRLADYVVRIESGQVIAEGPAAKLLAEPDEEPAIAAAKDAS
jgi:putative ABC transport system ATP-binding protein